MHFIPSEDDLSEAYMQEVKVLRREHSRIWLCLGGQTSERYTELVRIDDHTWRCPRTDRRYRLTEKET